ncbi:hypothetical protein ABBQ38_005901 [Trebouxia sp. C0009 RCD-2024]
MVQWHHRLAPVAAGIPSSASSEICCRGSHRHTCFGRHLLQQSLRNSFAGTQIAFAARHSLVILSRRRCVAAAAQHRADDDDDLTVSLYWPYKNLPPDGKTRTEHEELCNPEERSCQTPMHVYERACKTCQGTGSISSNTRGRRRTFSYVCLRCQGIGFVRHTSSRFMPPGLNNGSGDYTIGRPVPPPPEEEDKKRKYRSLRR